MSTHPSDEMSAALAVYGIRCNGHHEPDTRPRLRLSDEPYHVGVTSSGAVWRGPTRPEEPTRAAIRGGEVCAIWIGRARFSFTVPAYVVSVSVETEPDDGAGLRRSRAAYLAGEINRWLSLSVSEAEAQAAALEAAEREFGEGLSADGRWWTLEAQGLEPSASCSRS